MTNAYKSDRKLAFIYPKVTFFKLWSILFNHVLYFCCSIHISFQKKTLLISINQLKLSFIPNIKRDTCKKKYVFTKYAFCRRFHKIRFFIVRHLFFHLNVIFSFGRASNRSLQFPRWTLWTKIRYERHVPVVPGIRSDTNGEYWTELRSYFVQGRW